MESPETADWLKAISDQVQYGGRRSYWK